MTTCTDQTQSDRTARIIEEVTSNPSARVKVAVPDIDGIVRGKVVGLEKFNSMTRGPFGFCDVIFGWDCIDTTYAGIDYSGPHTGYPDMNTRLDMSTYRTIPWDDDSPFFLCDVEDGDGKPLEIAPRSLLKNIRKQSLELGMMPVFAQEFEWWNLCADGSGPLTSGSNCYSVLQATKRGDYFSDLFDALRGFGIPLEGIHTETGQGIYEAAILYDDIQEAADRACLFKTAVKEIANMHDVLASFVTKFRDGWPTCGGHIHQSMWNPERTTNLFAADGDMSDLMASYIAGQVHCLPYILPMYCPTINSYRRLVQKENWSPETASWGYDNRMTACRVILGGAKSTRVEMRVPGADVNPYLAMSASLASGLYGIRNKLKLDSETGAALPRSLGDAVRVMRESDIGNELFGEAFTKHFVQTREWEWEQFLGSVTDWELKRYLEVI